MRRILAGGALLLFGSMPVAASAQRLEPPLTPEQVASLPKPADRPVDFVRDIKPILQNSCVKCHGRGRAKGGFSLETRDAMLEGGDGGPAVTPGASETSHLIALVAGLDPDLVMPQKGTRLKPEQIGLLRAWIDQGAAWNPGVNFAKSEPRNIDPRTPALPDVDAATLADAGAFALAASHARAAHAPAAAGAAAVAGATASAGDMAAAGAAGAANPIDRLLAPYLASHGVTLGPRVDDRRFARRAYLDTIGLLPSPEELRAFVADRHPDKRERLVRRLLADRRRYADHWLSFWNDVLRNDYRGPGFIDGGRQQITAWLYAALLENVPYDRFVAQLINPTPGAGAEGFTKGIIWRGVVNASQTPPMQAAQNVSQVFMGVNLKCASCHDSFINDWQLADAYGLASLYADAPLEMVECDRPTGRKAPAKFLYAKLGSIDARAARAERLQRLADIVTGQKNGRLSRTIVNRLWARFMGRGLVEPVDDMEQPAWHPDLLDWLAEDLVAHGYDLKQTMARILTSRAYQSAAVNDASPSASTSTSTSEQQTYVFRGPGIRRMSAEQFADAVSEVTGVWQGLPAGDFDFTALQKDVAPPLRGRWIWNGSTRQATEDDVLFRKRFALTALPRSARALVAYDGPLAVYVNGRKVADTGASSTPRLVDIKAALRTGNNLIAIAAKRPPPPAPAPAAAPTPTAAPAHAPQPQAAEVQSAAAAQADALQAVQPQPEAAAQADVAQAVRRQPAAPARPAMPGLFAEVLVRREADLPVVTLVSSDATWRWSAAPMLVQAAVPVAASTSNASRPTASASSAVPAWAEMRFGDGTWAAAVALADTSVVPQTVTRALARAVAAATLEGRARAALVAADPLATALGRPNREQVVTTRASAATTLQALELSNGTTLTRVLQQGAEKLVSARPASALGRDALISRVYQRALGRAPTAAEAKACRELLGGGGAVSSSGVGGGSGAASEAEAVQDLLWAVVMLPEFQLIY